MTTSQHRKRLLDFARVRGIFRASEVESAGIHSEWLSRLVTEGALERAARGRYRLAGMDTTEHHTLAIATAVAPSAVVCLLSALQFHRIGTQAPLDVWLAVERGMGRPRLDYPPLRIVYFSGLAFTSGIERHSIERQEVQVYSVAKTIADCFKYRNKIGLDVALEALTDAWRQRRLSLRDLNAYAEIDRVQRVIQPYVEVLIQ